MGDDMTRNIFNENMLEVFLFETTEFMEHLEECLLIIEKSKKITKKHIDEIFRIMHTTKSSAAMMQLGGISELTHKFEDLFYYIRENGIIDANIYDITQIGFMTIDFIRIELAKLENGQCLDGDSNNLKERIAVLLEIIKESTERVSKEVKISNVELKPNTLIRSDENRYEAKVYFDNECGMLNIRAFTVIRNLTDYCSSIDYVPKELMVNDNACEIIAKDGFIIRLSTDCGYDEIRKIISASLFVLEIKLSYLPEGVLEEKKSFKDQVFLNANGPVQKNSIIGVNIEKMDRLMDLVGEIVITESMVINNPDLKGLELDNFQKASAHLRKLNNELQSVVMSIRMIPIGTTFHNMLRIVRDMNRAMGKDVELHFFGEETELDKGIIDNISDPLMHLVRNSMDHGIEDPKDREKAGKPENGKITLTAQNNGTKVIITISDDGKGLDKHNIYEKGKMHGFVQKSEEQMTDKEIFSMIFLAGFSTSIDITEYSGRGVGLDVVKNTIEKLGGSISVDSVKGQGTTINMIIPQALSIVDGMKVSIGKSVFIIPITSIKEYAKIKQEDIVKDVADSEMAMIRGQAYPVLRLHEYFDIPEKTKDITQGIIVVVEAEASTFCIFVDSIIGEQQVIVKPIPSFISKNQNTNMGAYGCAILDDATISMIIDVNGLYTQLIEKRIGYFIYQ